MSDLGDPDALGRHLTEIATAWQGILDGLDASVLEVFGRVEALALSWAAMQRRVLQPFEVNYAELSTLGILRTAPKRRCPLVRLRGLVGQSSAGMTRILDKLCAQGWVEREDAGGDRRRIDVRLTAEGIAIAGRVHEAMLGAEAEMLGPLGPEERQTLKRALDTLLRAFATSR